MIKSLRKSVIALIVGSVWHTYAYCQLNPTIEIDSTTYKAKSVIPFDRPFNLKFQGSDTEGIISARLYEVFYRKMDGGKKRPTVLTKWGERKIQDTSIAQKKGNKYLKEIATSKLLTKETTSVTLSFTPLPPETLFAIFLIKEFKKDELKRILEVFHMKDLKLEGDNSITDEQILKKEKELNNRYSKFPDFFDTQIPIRTYGFLGKGDLSKFYQENLKVEYDSILKPSAYDYLKYSPELELGWIEKVSELAQIHNVQIDSIHILRKFLSEEVFTSDLLKGLATIHESFESKKINIYAFGDRVSNISYSINYMRYLKNQSLKLRMQSDASELINTLQSLDSLIKKLTENEKYIKEINTSILKSISDEKRLRYHIWASGSTEIATLKSKGSYSLIPDLGTAFVYAFGVNDDEIIARPYIGASIYLRPVDKNIKYRYLTNRFLHQFSFNVGLTLGAINQGEISDFYNKTSLLTGVNYKLTRALALSGGLAWLRRQDPNPAIDSTSISFGTYFGLSIDLDFANGISKLTGKVY